MSESAKQTAILKKLRKIKNGHFTKPTVTNDRGIPDIIGHVDGHVIYIEVKRSNDAEPSVIQRYRIDKLKKQKAIAFWTSSWEDCYNKLREFLERKGSNIDFL